MPPTLPPLVRRPSRRPMACLPSATPPRQHRAMVAESPLVGKQSGAQAAGATSEMDRLQKIDTRSPVNSLVLLLHPTLVVEPGGLRTWAPVPWKLPDVQPPTGRSKPS